MGALFGKSKVPLRCHVRIARPKLRPGPSGWAQIESESTQSIGARAHCCLCCLQQCWVPVNEKLAEKISEVETW